jgi:hypothetical protein
MSTLTRQRAAETAGVLPPPAPRTFQSQAGWKRVFLSPRDAEMYSQGWAQWPQAMNPELAASTPYRTGWLDADSDELMREEARRDRAHEELWGQST